MLARVLPGLETAGAIDPALEPLVARMQSVRYEADDIAGELRRYGAEIESVPGRLEEVEERLALLSRLVRKYGGSVEAVLAYAEECRGRRDELDRAEVRIEEVEGVLAAAESELEDLAGSLSEVRNAAAPALAKAVRERLAELSSCHARRRVRGPGDAPDRRLRCQGSRCGRAGDRPQPGDAGRADPGHRLGR